MFRLRSERRSVAWR